MKTTTFKTVKTIKDYTLKYDGYTITVPAGSRVSNKTACGYDNNYRFWQDWREIAEKLTGFKNSLLSHNLTYYGINVPAEYCEAYPEN